MSPRSFCQIDFALVPKAWLSGVSDIHSHRDEALASHHFLVSATLMTAIPICENKPSKRRLATSCLRDKSTANKFACLVTTILEDEAMSISGVGALEKQEQKLANAMHQAGCEILPTRFAKRRRATHKEDSEICKTRPTCMVGQMCCRRQLGPD